MILTEQEFEREWLKLLAFESICPSDMPTKWIRNWTDRGFLTLSEQNPGIRKPRLYSCRSGIQATCLYHLSLCANPLPFARKIARIAEARALDLVTGQTSHLLPGTAYCVSNSLGPLSSRDDWEDLASDEAKPVFLYALMMDGTINGCFVDPGRLSDVAYGYWQAVGLVGMEKRFLPIDELVSWLVLRYFDGVDSGELARLNERQR